MENVVFFLFAVMVVVVFANVVARYVFNSALTTSEEIARICFVWLVFLGAVLALEHNEHLGFDLLVTQLPKRIAWWVSLVAEILIGGVVLLLFGYSLRLVHNNMNWPAPATNIPYGVIDLVMPISFALMALIIARKIYLGFKSRR
jgi:TRAP-type C4-dicarboxylate transport system permease small subunit